MRIKRIAKSDIEVKKPLLSIGMIFKNEIRCLERCMKALQPLRDAIPCELVMADTGSDDGSREIAEKHADIFFDFPWINDFAAARNAVMERCSGRWYLSLDCDEWFDEDVSALVEFLTGPDGQKNTAAGLTIRNYTSKDLDRYGDMLGVRLLRMDTGVRFGGAIHESFDFPGEQIVFVVATVLHHDGYVAEGGPGGKVKQDRNMPLLEKQLEKTPKDLRVLMECIESARDNAERMRYLHMAVEYVKERSGSWKKYGPAILRYHVFFGQEEDAAELESRAALAEELFPDSPFTVIDISYIMLHALSTKEEYAKAIPYGEKYLEFLAKYRKKEHSMTFDTLFGTLMMTPEVNERESQLILADDYYREKRYREAVDLVKKMDPGKFNADLVRNYVGVLMNLHSAGEEDLSGYLAELWKQKTGPEKDEAALKEFRDAMAAAAGLAFQKKWRDKETEEGRRHAYTLFLPVADQCETGLAAAVLETMNPITLTEKLLTVENWNKFSIHALAHALERGVVFPLPGKQLTMEEADSLADRMSRTDDVALFAIEAAKQAETPAQLNWARGLLLSAMQFETGRLQQAKQLIESTEIFVGAQEDEEQAERTMELARTFAEAEKRILDMCYSPAALTKENLFLLPPMHRFGWHCARAFEALNSGDPVGYVRCLRQGLSTCEGMKDMVEFLIDHTPEVQITPPSQELLELADKVRTMLSVYDPADPIVEAIKQTPAYQKVAYLIEGVQAPVFGGLAQ